ncbi:hypothetical protein BSG1_03815 [Bacillus sp. SG-1]|nr:hypothetical protein BSG1_03815 [Bacillus sp. SG-1]
MVMSALTGFEKQQYFNIKEVNIEVKDNILSYEVILQTDDGTPIESRYDYPGQKIQGFELAVIPNKPLADLMELEIYKESKFTKMRPNQIGTRASSREDEIILFSEYVIKNNSDLVKLEKLAMQEAILFIFDGANKIKEQPISRNLY